MSSHKPESMNIQKYNIHVIGREKIRNLFHEVASGRFSVTGFHQQGQVKITFRHRRRRTGNAGAECDQKADLVPAAQPFS